MQFRHEVKHEISNHDMLILRQRLRTVMKPDSHAMGGQYAIRSLYFDNLDDKALREKLDGVNIVKNTESVYTTMILPLSAWNGNSNTVVLDIRILRV